MSEVWFNPSGPMVCASGDAESNIYEKHIGKSGDVWFVKTGSGRASNIYASTKNKEGFGVGQ